MRPEVEGPEGTKVSINVGRMDSTSGAPVCNETLSRRVVLKDVTTFTIYRHIQVTVVFINYKRGKRSVKTEIVDY